jgi:putative polyhydroxyalkanoate system protein
MEAQIDVSRAHSLDQNEINRRVEQIAKEFETEWGVSWQWATTQLVAFKAQKGLARGIQGEIAVSSGSIRVRMSLPLMLISLRKTIAREVERVLGEQIG